MKLKKVLKKLLKKELLRKSNTFFFDMNLTKLSVYGKI